MSQTTKDVFAVYVDGETKTGKGAASVAIAEALKASGLAVYYDVAGDFYRRYVAIVRRELGLNEEDDLPTGEVLQTVAQRVYESRQALEKDDSLGDLQRHAISKSVSVLGELSIAQQAGLEWFGASIERALAMGAEVIVLDGRNPRRRVEEQLKLGASQVHTALDLYMTCEPAEAARRALIGRGVAVPNEQQIVLETDHVMERRNRDRNRANRPFLAPDHSVVFDIRTMQAAEAVAASWVQQPEASLPVTITLDNTGLLMDVMLGGVSELAVAAVGEARRRV